MKISITTIAISALLMSSVLTSAVSAGSLRAEREARTLRIEALTQAVASGRLNRSQKILAKLQIASLQADARKQRRLADRARDRRAALNRRGLLH